MAVRRPGRKASEQVVAGGLAGLNPSVVSGETRELSDDYFDTEDWRIYRAGFALRIRHKGDEKRAEATLKLLASKNGKRVSGAGGRYPSPLTAGTPRS